MLVLFLSLAFRTGEMFINEEGKVVVELYDKMRLGIYQCYVT
jgi:hypothetical protein